ncbi:hypothetical protein DFQ00_102351 [Paenibacillus barcinonensis]|uniref:Uncharacterized protein n=1 Tax=Paenibacillus barcinonensis TaxID=198119 RepID=A0A2V4VVS0_PAEBA|nr:hypothetical protein [Paenibacillus barcinonensis]PYE51557.1 hypothetical protein DFQ00_102351 [Paenibacillus barcinonensis]
MNRLKTVKCISETSVDEMVRQIVSKQSDINKVIESAKASRTEYGLKVQELIERLES